MQTAAAIKTRWMIHSDLPEVIDVEQASLTPPYEEDDFRRFMRKICDYVCLVAVDRERTVGYVVYQLHDKKIVLLSVAVHPEYRRQGVGRILISRCMRGLDKRGRTHAAANINEWNLEGQLFMRSCGFHATRVLRNGDEGDDIYLMVKKKRRSVA